MNELESGIIPLLFKEGNVSALKQSVNSFTRPDALGQLITLASRAISRVAASVLSPTPAVFVYRVTPGLQMPEMADR